MSDPAVPAALTLPALQAHIDALCEARGWHKNSNEERFLLMIEEVGELAKAMRKAAKIQIEQNNPDKPVWTDAQIQANLAEEFADVLMYLADLANMFGVDLEQAYRGKIAAIAQRNWT
jgi:NTP pyrophosphatase (non-canonical NTP hydrolase)